MKKTIWVPIVIGVAFGLLAGITEVAGFTFNINPGGAPITIGFYMVLYALSAALGGPIAGFLTVAIDIIAVALFGPPDVKALFNDPIIFWTNLIDLGVVLALFGFAYRFIYQRFKMPLRLLTWAGIVIAAYIIVYPILVISQYLLGYYHDTSVIGIILSGLKGFAPQAISDIIITSLIWIGLPESFRRPLWYEPKK